MTEVAGPLGPVGRLSSLPILGTQAALPGAAKASRFEDNVSMAQSFEIPQQNRTAIPQGPRVSFSEALPDRLFPADPFAGSMIGIWDRGRSAASARLGGL